MEDYMIRSFLVIVFLILFFIFSLIALPVEWVIGKFNPDVKAVSSLRIVQGAFHIILFLAGVHTTVTGLENIPDDEPVLFIGNHRGFFDVIISYTYMKRPTGFVAKKEMKKALIIRRWMDNLFCLFLDRENMKEGLKTILKGIDYIKDGKSIVIFRKAHAIKAKVFRISTPEALNLQKKQAVRLFRWYRPIPTAFLNVSFRA